MANPLPNIPSQSDDIIISDAATFNNARQRAAQPAPASPNPPASPPSRLFLTLQAAFKAPPGTPTIFRVTSNIVSSITTSSDPDRALSYLWGTFCDTILTSTSSTGHIAFLNAMRSHPPTWFTPEVTWIWSSLPGFQVKWDDMWERLYSCHKKDDKHMEYLHFCAFSTSLVQSKLLSPLSVFDACTEVLERRYPEPNKTIDALWAVDVQVTALWLRDGGQALWNKVHRDPFYYATYPTELWPDFRAGLTIDRWKFWQFRLWCLTGDRRLVTGTRLLVKEAAETCQRLLRSAQSHPMNPGVGQIHQKGPAPRLVPS